MGCWTRNIDVIFLHKSLYAVQYMILKLFTFIIGYDMLLVLDDLCALTEVARVEFGLAVCALFITLVPVS